jgi:hypothetical protein
MRGRISKKEGNKNGKRWKLGRQAREEDGWNE